MGEQKSVLIVEDDGILAIHLSQVLKGLGYGVLGQVATGEAAIALVAAEKPNLVLMDIQLAGEIDGITAVSHIHSAVELPVVFLTSYSQNPQLERAKFTAPYGYLIKPVSPQEMAVTIEMAFHEHAIDR